MILDFVCSVSVEDDFVIEIVVVIEKSVVSGVLLMGVFMFLHVSVDSLYLVYILLLCEERSFVWFVICSD